MDPVDGDVVESHVKKRRDDKPTPTISLHIAVEQAMAADFAQEPGESQNVDEWDSSHGRFDFLAYLILQKPWVVLQASIEDQIVRQCAEEKVKGRRAELRNQQDRNALAVDVVAVPEGHRRRIRGQEVVHI